MSYSYDNDLSRLVNLGRRRVDRLTIRTGAAVNKSEYVVDCVRLVTNMAWLERLYFGLDISENQAMLDAAYDWETSQGGWV